VGLSEEEDKVFEDLWPRYKVAGEDPEYQRHVETNWSVVFDLDSPRGQYLEETHGRLARVQACVDRIYLDEVQSVRWAD